MIAHMPTPVCHIVHLVYRFTTGGLENVVVQLVNKLPHQEFRHTVVAITEVDPQFAQRILRPDVEFISLNKAPGQPFELYPKMYRLLKRLRPDVVHSCNLAAMEFAPVAAMARVPLRVHVEHGWDVGDLGGSNARYNLLRKFYKPFVQEFVAVATPLHEYLLNNIGVPSAQLQLIPNGVDTNRFRPRTASDPPPIGFPFQRGVHWVIGYVGRLVAVKNPMLLVEAFIALAQSSNRGAERIRLAMVGEGPLAVQVAQRMQQAGLHDRLWLPGVRDDTPELFRAIDCFVLPSLFEATSCTLQEAMATGLEIVVTDVGGNADLLEGGRFGSLVPSENVSAMAGAIQTHFARSTPTSQTTNAVEAINRRYGLTSVIDRYRRLFLGLPNHESAMATAKQMSSGT